MFPNTPEVSQIGTRQVVAYKRLKTMENCMIVSSKSASCGRTRDMVAYTRGGRTWRFDHVFCRLFYNSAV